MAKLEKNASIEAAQLYTELFENRTFFIQAMEDQPGATLAPIAKKGKEQLLAAADSLFDQGRRDLLVKAINSPALGDNARKLLASYLYGTNLVSPMLARLTAVVV